MERHSVQWKPHLDKQASSGLTAQEYCRREGLSCWSFYAARAKTRHKPHGKKIATASNETVPVKSNPLHFIRVHSPEATKISVRFPDTTILEINGSIAPEQLSTLVETLRGSFKTGITKC